MTAKVVVECVEKGVIAKLQNMIAKPFVRMDYTEAVNILQNCGQKFEYPVSWGTDLQSEHERYLAEQHVNDPVVLQNYPKDIKSFYMRMNDDGKTVAAMDILAPSIGEIIGGSQREERLDILDARMAEVGLGKRGFIRYARSSPKWDEFGSNISAAWLVPSKGICCQNRP